MSYLNGEKGFLDLYRNRFGNFNPKKDFYMLVRQDERGLFPNFGYDEKIEKGLDKVVAVYKGNDFFDLYKEFDRLEKENKGEVLPYLSYGEIKDLL